MLTPRTFFTLTDNIIWLGHANAANLPAKNQNCFVRVVVKIVLLVGIIFLGNFIKIF